ncbi:MAG: Flp family type IVb pilin [Pseudomonadota bacterium]
MQEFFKNESGATAVEYGLIAALIAVAIIGAVQALGTELKGTFEVIDSKVGGATTTAKATV